MFVTSDMIMDWLGYSLIPGRSLVGPVLGTAIFFYGGWPFLPAASTRPAPVSPG